MVVVKGAYLAGNQSERREISRDRALDQSDCRMANLHIQDGAMMKKGGDVTSGDPNKARPEVKVQDFLLTTIFT